MNFKPARLIPHILVLRDRGAADVAAIREAHVVYPSADLARRYAKWIVGQYGAVFVAQPAPPGSRPVTQASDHACVKCGCTDHFACPSNCFWVAEDICSECAANTDWPEVWVVFDRPVDFPRQVIARKWVDGLPTEEVIAGNTIEEVRAQKPSHLEFVVSRQPFDPPSMIELWT